MSSLDASSTSTTCAPLALLKALLGPSGASSEVSVMSSTGVRPEDDGEEVVLGSFSAPETHA